MYWMTCSRCAVEKSMSMSGVEVIPSWRKRSKSRLCAIGSTRVMPSTGDDRVGGRAPALAGDPALAREAHEVPVDEEELGQPGLLDHVQLPLQAPRHRGGDRVVSPARSLLGQPVEEAERGLALGHREAREADIPE